MLSTWGHRLTTVQRSLHSVALFAVILLSAALVIFTLLSAFGVMPWLTFTAQFGEFVIPSAGVITQITLTVFASVLALYIPSNLRILDLERAHRKFHITMDDVTRAYHASHAADRAGTFTLSSEFDAVRERIAYMRDHPDLESLEPDVLEVAAQMSASSRDLATVYSDEKVARAKTFLQQRQEEVEKQQARIIQAHHSIAELRQWTQQVELEESVVASQIQRLEEDMMAILPPLGYDFSKADENVVPIIKNAAE